MGVTCRHGYGLRIWVLSWPCSPGLLVIFVAKPELNRVKLKLSGMTNYDIGNNMSRNFPILPFFLNGG